MADTVLARRPPVATITIRMMGLAPYIQFLKPSSMLRMGQVAKAVWYYLDSIRQIDIAQPVDDQSRLAGFEAAARRLAIDAQRYYLDATGPLDLQLTQDASAAIDLVLGWDVITTPTFDLEKAVLRILKGARIV